ncbi:MAG TPA: NTP transferase domain-containing protein [Capillimicrobium sp.]|nr:NTP transferase domain-containing protein [Capillimicrobium sp.]
MAGRVIAVVQARTGSTRLPGKVLADLAGAPLLARLLERLRRATRVDGVVVATSDLAQDDPVAQLARDAGVPCHRGSETDVLARVRDAARAHRADAVVRITGDCPLVDPAVVDLVVDGLTDDVDYASNILRRTFPRGLDAEALHMDVLERVARLGRSPDAREHVTWFIYRERPDLFVLRSVEHPDGGHADLQWSVDTPEDLERVRDLYTRHRLDERDVAWTELLT